MCLCPIAAVYSETVTTLHYTALHIQPVVYIGVQGQDQQNAFNIIVWDQLFDPSDVTVNILEGGTGRQLIYNVRQHLVGRAPSSK